MSTDLDDLLNDGIESVFFEDFGTVVTKEDIEYRVIVERGVEVIADDGGIDIISIAIACKPNEFDTNDTFIFKDTLQAWVVGRLLIMAPDKRLATYEISASAGA